MSQAGNVSTNNFGELVLLTVTGSDIKATAAVRSVSLWTGFMQQGNPVDFNFRMKNDGNTHFDAQGQLVLTDWLGKKIGSYDVGQLTVYPKTSRLFQWRWSGTPMIGIYEASVLLSSPGANNKFNPVDGMWFILFPWEAVLGILVAFAIVFALIKYRAFYLSKFSRLKIKIRTLPSTPVKNMSGK